MDKNKWVYVGIGVFFLLIALNSTKKIQLNPIEIPKVDESEIKSFDSNSLPIYLKPPNRLNDGDKLPKLNVPKRLLGFAMGTTKKRFDI
jgi:hypothetical protein